MAKTITIYTTNTCVYCKQVKKFLESKGLDYQVVNIDEQPQRANELLELTGQLAVPVTVVHDEDDPDSPKDVTVGWNPGKLTAAVATLAKPESQNSQAA